MELIYVYDCMEGNHFKNVSHNNKSESNQIKVYLQGKCQGPGIEAKLAISRPIIYIFNYLYIRALVIKTKLVFINYICNV